jgi:hypothetical protein
MTLKTSIQQAERSIAQRRARIDAALEDVARSVRKRMVSPDVLFAAALFGAALHREHRLHGLHVTAALEIANSGLRLLLAQPARTRTSATNP